MIRNYPLFNLVALYHHHYNSEAGHENKASYYFCVNKNSFFL